MSTPKKTNMESEKGPLVKEKHLYKRSPGGDFIFFIFIPTWGIDPI